MIRVSTRPLALCGLLVLSSLPLSGCDAQVDPSYAGEAAARIRGTAVGFDDGETAGAAAILWNRNDGPDVPSGPLESEPLHQSFPSGLGIDVLGKPPAGAFFGFPDEGAAIAEGYLFLVREGVDGAPTVNDLVAAAVDHVLVYVEGRVEPDSLTAAYLGGVRAPGYHLLWWLPTADLTDAQRALASRCADALVAAGSTTPDQAAADCRAPRLYQLTGTAADLATIVPFFRHQGGL